jgi:hypothetical protein
MRTTLSLDEDVAALLLRREQDELNRFVRPGVLCELLRPGRRSGRRLDLSLSGGGCR